MNESPAGKDAFNLVIMREAIHYNRFLVDLIVRQVRPFQRVLDFGAGNGNVAITLAKAGYAIECVEPDDRLASSIARAGLLVHANVSNLPAESFDLIYALNVLEHIMDDAAVLGVLSSKLRPGGQILVYVPAFSILSSSMDRKVGHLRRYTRKDLREKVTLAGLRVVRDEYADSIGFLASLLYRLLRKKSGDINRRVLRLYDRFIFPVSRMADRLCRKFIGKNIFLLAEKPSKHEAAKPECGACADARNKNSNGSMDRL